MNHNRITSDDFFTGLFSALAQKGHRVLALRGERFDKAIAGVADKLMSEAAERDVKVRFRIKLHPVHGDSQTVRDSLAHAAQRDLISFDNPEYQDIRLRISESEAESLLGSLPGGKDLFTHLADEFLQAYT